MIVVVAVVVVDDDDDDNQRYCRCGGTRQRLVLLRIVTTVRHAIVVLRWTNL